MSNFSSRLGHLSIKSRLVLTVAMLLVAGLVAVSAFNFLSLRSTTLASVNASAQSLALARAEGIGQWIASKSAVVGALLPATQVEDPMTALTQAVKSGAFDTTYIGYQDKRAIFSTPQNLPSGWDPTGRPWYQKAASGQGVVLTEPYVDSDSKKLVMTFAAADRNGSEIRAVAAGDVFMDVVAAAVTAIKPTPSSDAFVLSSNGKVMVHAQLDRVLKDAVSLSPALTPAAVAALGAELTEVTIDGSARLLTAVPVAGTDWKLVISLHKGEALASVSDFLMRSLIGALVVTVIAALLAGVVVARSLQRLDRLQTAMQDVASGDGDLTKRLDASGHDELARIAQAFNAFVDKIQATLRDIASASEAVHNASREIATGNHDLSSRTESAASNLQETSATMEEMTATVAQSAQSAQEANQIAGSAAASAARGGEVVGQVVSSMEAITHSSRKINDIISVIDGIAFQTNILALNAAVEAARAGEQGRGFAVVAAEVRNLAQRSAEAAKEIKQLIGSSVENVEAGSALVGRTGAVMEEIVQNVQRVSQMMQAVAAAASEQRSGIAQVGSAISNLDQMTQQNAALVEESAAAASGLQDQAERLSRTVGQFRIG
ncbi:MAG: HAMP domain-containing protein [Hydrogenophaga sp.]|uniref:methyl-accepting chemotaxis protein n=1 Tax=Hydrogenophaga sp. TaxID=1904254 RepID=UPI0025BA0537|nr:methyl-accepting chemotaxis protein [Hydrogenophaga sp.]MBT9550533.1 HAMP domain-containing protein [Hydrogenophaga sp.]